MQASLSKVVMTIFDQKASQYSRTFTEELQ